MPISLRVIEQKLLDYEFANMSELESFFKRMVTNAKEFYHKGSENFEDAERVRKALSNYMTKTNPAYKLIPGYSCQATPIPAVPNPTPKEAPHDDDDDAEGEEDAEADEDAEGEEVEPDNGGRDREEEDEEEEGGEEEAESRKRIVLKRRGNGRSSRTVSSPAPRSSGRGQRSRLDHEYEDVPYQGLGFQQAQEKIVEELIRKPDGS